jgi:RNA-binding protein 23/39
MGNQSDLSDEEAWDQLERRLVQPRSNKRTANQRLENAKTVEADDTTTNDGSMESAREKLKTRTTTTTTTTTAADNDNNNSNDRARDDDEKKKKIDDREVDADEFTSADDDDDDERVDKKASTAIGQWGRARMTKDERKNAPRSRSRSRDRKVARNRSRSRDRVAAAGRNDATNNRGRRRDRDDSRDNRRETSAEREANKRRRKEERRAMEEKRALEKIDRDTRTCFAYNLSSKSDERDIFKFFMKAGEVLDVRIIYDRNRPISKGMAYVEFSSKDSIPKALELTGETLRGQKVMVKQSEAEKNIAWEAEQATKVNMRGKAQQQGAQKTGPCALFVAGLHEGLAEEDVKAVFEPFGALDAIEISRDKKGESNGHGIVRYREWAHAMLAVSQLNGLELVGQALKISIAAGQEGNNKTNNNNNRKGDDDDDDDQLGGGQMDDTATYARMDAAKRAELMQKLAGGDASTIGAIPTATLTHNAVKIKTKEEEKRELIMMTQGFFGPSSPIPTNCILLKNLFDPSEETDEEWWLDIQEDVKGEVSKYGECVHAFVDKENPYGFCYLKFEDVEAAKRAQFGLNNRFFGGRSLICDFQFAEPYKKHFKL